MARRSVRGAAGRRAALGGAPAGRALVRDPRATSYGGRCAQLASGNGPRVDNEDCLYLNVYTPPGADRGGRRGHQLPVLFMIHGGGLTSGAGDQHDGSLIVNTDHIIVVSINYRLGPFGFLTLPGLGTSRLTTSGNYGLLDQEAALRWVQRNIAAFGGDPRQVTIDGESAGGWSVCALMTSPLAHGLFRSAIMQSGSCATQTRATAEANSLAFAKAGGVPGCGDRRGLPARPARADFAERQYQLSAAVHLGGTGAAGPGRAGGGLRPLQPGAVADRHQPQRGPHVLPGPGRADRAAGRPGHHPGLRLASAGHPGPVPVGVLPEPVHRGLHDR